MNVKRIAILIIAGVLVALILWHDLPIEFPMVIAKVLLLFGKLIIVFAVTVFAFIFTGDEKKSSS